MHDVASKQIQETIGQISFDQRGALKAKKHIPWSQLTFAVITVTIILWLISVFAFAPTIRWSVFGEYLFHREILQGALATLQLTAISVVIAFAIAVVLAFMRESSSGILRGASAFYVWIFRAVPLLVQLILWFNLALIFPELGLRIPFTNIGVGWDTNAVITPFMAAIFGLALHEAAYMSEVVRGGILSVPKGQTEAALSIGMTRFQVMKTIVLPQATRVIIPPAANQVIILLKGSSVVSVIGGGDLLTNAQNIYSINYEVSPLLFVASFWYMVMIAFLSILQSYLETWQQRSVLTQRADQLNAAQVSEM